MSVGPPYSVEQTTTNACPSASVMTVSFRPGQSSRVKVGAAVRAIVVEVAIVVLSAAVAVRVVAKLVMLIAV